ncbi:MAG: PD-(D/E)XK nuclease family protein, partial [Myxococcota bacterium]
EVRAVADRVRLRLDAGQDPEAIAVVCRDVERYRVAIRQHFRRLGIPFSGVGEKGSTGATRRRVQALLDLLRQGGRTPADRWLEATARLDSVSPSDSHADLRLALRHIGAVRVADVAAQPPRRRDLSLPAVGAWKDGEEEGEVARASRRMLSLDAFARGVAAARRVCRQLDRIGTARCLGARLDELRRLLCEGLGWEAQAPECRPVLDAVEALTRALPADFSLTDDDFQLLLRRAFDPLGAEPIGGAGGGVQVLSVMEARARTFGDLFVIGLNRGVFPRRVRPDPLLPDLVRRKLAEVLPDLPIKATSIEEDRYLFAQLLSSSPRVTLSWQTATDDGVDCARSTLVERLRWGSEGFEPLGVPPLCPRPTADGPRAGRQTPAEAAQRAGLYAPARAGFAEALALACEDVDRSLPGGLRVGRADAATRGRLRVLDEFDPPRPRPAGLGPYFGFTGAVAEAGDPRTGPLYITNVEALARCPWQSFLSRLLRLFPPPDPLAALPGSDPRLLGLVVHRALEDIAQVALGDPPSSLDDARLRAPVRIVWPQGDALEKLLRRAASHVLTEDGIAMNGLARILADQARRFVERARELDAGDDADGGVVAAELKGSIPWADGRTLSFRADRVDLSDGNLVLTDYKTGRPISTGVNASTREKHLLAAVSRGESLQAAIYAVAAGGDGEGRFVFLRPGLIPDHAEYAVRSDREDVLAPFRAAVESALRAIDAGAFVPRLTGEDLQTENPDCERCELATACIRGDSGFRMRLTRWLEADGADRGGDAERALRAIWNLRAQKRAESKPVESP